ncbi:MAG: hypothetical protein QXV23_02260 [Candidatus Bathyarchaeia archaeon]
MKVKRKIFGLRLPIAIFIILILTFFLTGYLLIYFTLLRNLSEDGECISFETDFFRFKFPRNWYAQPKWENDSLCIINVLTTEYDSFLGLIYYKSWEYAQSIFSGLDLRDGLLITTFEVNRFYGELHKRSQNATLQFLRNGSLEISGYSATYTIFRIENVAAENLQYNFTGIIIYFLTDRGAVEIVFYTWIDRVWEERYETFKAKILELLVIKHGA